MQRLGRGGLSCRIILEAEGIASGIWRVSDVHLKLRWDDTAGNQILQRKPPLQMCGLTQVFPRPTLASGTKGEGTGGSETGA